MPACLLLACLDLGTHSLVRDNDIVREQLRSASVMPGLWLYPEFFHFLFPLSLGEVTTVTDQFEKNASILILHLKVCFEGGHWKPSAHSRRFCESRLICFSSLSVLLTKG